MLVEQPAGTRLAASQAERALLEVLPEEWRRPKTQATTRDWSTRVCRVRVTPRPVWLMVAVSTV